MLQEPRLSGPAPCPYLEGRVFVQEYFFADYLDEKEFDGYLTRGWRRFGTFFFRPSCPGCRACVPLRVSAEKLFPSGSQKRVIRKNRETGVKAAPLAYRERLFEIYRDHSHRFDGEERDRASFEETYFRRAVPSFLTEYYRGGELAAAGFVDVAASGFSSVYFVYDSAYDSLSLGTWSVFAEARMALEAGLEWYYLGYYVADSPRMVYKGKFFPRQLYSWEKECWEDG